MVTIILPFPLIYLPIVAFERWEEGGVDRLLAYVVGYHVSEVNGRRLLSFLQQLEAKNGESTPSSKVQANDEPVLFKASQEFLFSFLKGAGRI